MADLRTRTPEDQAKLEAFERRMRWPIFVSAVLPIILTLADNDNTLATVVIVATWFVFVVDFAVHVRLIPRYARSGRGRFDLVVVLLTAPWFLIPGLGTSRFLGLARLARLARIAKAGGGAFVRLGQQLGQVGLVLLGVLVTCAYVAYGAEESVNEEFSSFGQSMWWAIVTTTTVGYGDITPTTTNGRIAGVLLMLSGVAFLGVVAGTLASFFGFGGDGEEPVADSAAARTGASASGPDTEPAIAAAEAAAAEVAELRARLAELDRALAAVREKIG
jgi:voltage-gated potassium channel